MASRISGDGYDLKVGLSVDTQEGARQFNEFLKNAKKIGKTVKIPLEIDGEKFEKQIRIYEDELGSLVKNETIKKFEKGFHSASQTVSDKLTEIITVEQRFNNELKKQETSLKNQQKESKKTSDALNKQANSTRNLETQQKNLNTETKKSVDVFSDFTATFEKMVKFNTINMIYDGIIDSIRECVTITEEFNEATTELIKVSELSGDSLRQYTKELAEYGEDVGRTMTDMTNSATIFKRTGATDEEAKELARLAEMYRNVADSEISSAEASGFLVSQMKAFGIQAENSIHILDGVNEVANHFATSTDDLQTALTKSASALATAGNSYEQTIALVTSGVEVMQGQAGTVGNGLRTIAINVANLATKQNELVVANGKFSISLKDTNGEIRSTYDILSDLAQNWDKLNKAEQNAIAVQLAGKHKYKSLVLLA